MRSYRLIAIVILVALVAVASVTRVWTFGAELLVERARDFSIVPSEHEGWSETSRKIKHEVNQCEGKSINVSVPLAGIKVSQSTSGAALVEATITGEAESVIDTQIKVEERGDTIFVTAENSRSNVNVSSIEVVLMVPKGTSVAVHNSAGDIMFEGLTGDITASAGLGNIEATHVVGNLDLEVSSGDLMVTSATVLESMRLKSSMGDISFDGSLGKSNLVHSSSGEINLSVPSNTCVNLNAQTASGKLTSSLPVESLSSQGLGFSAQGLLGSGTPRGNLTISSSMGDVSIAICD